MIKFPLKQPLHTKVYIGIALFGSVFVHASILYGLWLCDTSLLYVNADEVEITHITVTEESPAPKPNPVVEEPQKEVVPPKELPTPKPIEPQKELLKKPIKKPVKTLVRSVEPEVSSETIVPQEETRTQEPVVQNTPVQTSAPKAQQSGSDDALSRYLAKVRKQIQGNLQYPHIAKRMGIEGETVVQFLIVSDGQIDKSSLKVVKSSGKRALDTNAMDAVLDAAPFEAPPLRDMNIVIPVVFKIKS